MDVPGYRPRIPDRAVEERLQTSGAVCLEGPKGCGKTWTAQEHCRSQILIGGDAGNFHSRQLAQMAPSLALSGEKPRLVDEWHETPAIWDAVRSEMEGGEKRQFILTASSAPQRRERVCTAAPDALPLSG